MSRNFFAYTFFGAWVLLAIVTFYILFRIKKPLVKRYLFRLLVVVASALVPLFILLMEFPRRVFYIALPGAIAIGILNIAFTKFCNTCGAVYRGALDEPASCPKCTQTR
jgi:hypothetical protein